jgi:hypothetical protein
MHAAGLLTCPPVSRLPVLPRSGRAVALKRNGYLDLQQRVLSGILTRFPFHECNKVILHSTDSEAKIVFVLSTPNKIYDHPDSWILYGNDIFVIYAYQSNDVAALLSPDSVACPEGKI